MRVKIQPKRILVGAGILALCAGVIVVGVAGIALASYQAAAHNGHVALPQPTPTPSSYGVTTPTCDAPGKPACPTPDPGWVQLASNSPSAVLAAIKQTWIFHLDLSDDGDHIHDVSHLGTPVFVHGIAPKGVTIPDFYVLPFMDAHGVITDVGTFELNTQHSALRLQGISSFDGRYPIVRQTVSTSCHAEGACPALSHLLPDRRLRPRNWKSGLERWRPMARWAALAGTSQRRQELHLRQRWQGLRRERNTYERVTLLTRKYPLPNGLLCFWHIFCFLRMLVVRSGRFQ
jgi:hypothetical protein